MTIHSRPPLAGVPCDRSAEAPWAPSPSRDPASGGQAVPASDPGLRSDHTAVDRRRHLSPGFRLAEFERSAPFDLPVMVDLFVALLCVTALLWAALVYAQAEASMPRRSSLPFPTGTSRRPPPPLESGELSYPDDDMGRD